MNTSYLRNSFQDFLIRQGYRTLTKSGKKSTVYDYLKRIDFVCSIENCNWEQIATSIELILKEYGPYGTKANLGSKSHNAVICALRQYQLFVKQENIISNNSEVENKSSISNSFLKSELEKRKILYCDNKQSFYEININGNIYTLKCRTYNGNYTYVTKSEIPELVSNIMIALVEWINNKPANVYLIPMSEWKNANNTILKDRDYNGLKSLPEWGIEINEKNKHELQRFSIDKILKIIQKEANTKLIQEIELLDKNKETEKQALIKVRLGHSKLKDIVLRIKKECDICGLNHSKLLIASHIKPWAVSTNEEKLDQENILLLCPMHDALFDKGLISFDSKGQILISKQLDEKNKALANINDDSFIKITSTKQIEYLKWHQENIYIG